MTAFSYYYFFLSLLPHKLFSRSVHYLDLPYEVTTGLVILSILLYIYTTCTHTNAHTHTHTHTNTHIYIYIYTFSGVEQSGKWINGCLLCNTQAVLTNWALWYASSSSSCRSASADIPDPLSPFLPNHSSPPAGLQGYILCPHIVAVCKFVLVVLLFTSICGGPQEYIAYELVLASPAVSRVSGSSDLYSFRDGGQVSV